MLLVGKTQILEKIADALLPGGYLILGTGESLLGLLDGFDQSVVDGAVLYQKRKASCDEKVA